MGYWFTTSGNYLVHLWNYFHFYYSFNNNGLIEVRNYGNVYIIYRRIGGTGGAICLLDRKPIRQNLHLYDCH